jgi:hypothetical protein
MSREEQEIWLTISRSSDINPIAEQLSMSSIAFGPSTIWHVALVRAEPDQFCCVKFQEKLSKSSS